MDAARDEPRDGADVIRRDRRERSNRAGQRYRDRETREIIDFFIYAIIAESIRRATSHFLTCSGGFYMFLIYHMAALKINDERRKTPQSLAITGL